MCWRPSWQPGSWKASKKMPPRPMPSPQGQLATGRGGRKATAWPGYWGVTVAGARHAQRAAPFATRDPGVPLVPDTQGSRRCTEDGGKHGCAVWRRGHAVPGIFFGRPGPVLGRGSGRRSAGQAPAQDVAAWFCGLPPADAAFRTHVRSDLLLGCMVQGPGRGLPDFDKARTSRRAPRDRRGFIPFGRAGRIEMGTDVAWIEYPPAMQRICGRCIASTSCSAWS